MTVCLAAFPVCRTGSDGQCNTCMNFTRRILEARGFSRALIQAQRDLVELRLRKRAAGRRRAGNIAVAASSCFLCAALPRALRIAKVHLH